MKFKIFVFIFVLVISLTAIFLIESLGYKREYLSFFTDVSQEVEHLGLLSVLGFILIYVFAAVFVFWVPIHTLTLIGGVLFGSCAGALYSMVAVILGAMSSFKLVRYIGKGVVSNFISKRTEWIQKIFHSMGNNGFIVVLTLRLMHFIPYRGINYTAGIAPVSFRDFVSGSLIGLIPAVLFYSYLGSSLAELNPLEFGVAVSLAVVFSFFIYLQQRRMILRGRFRGVFDNLVYLKDKREGDAD